jgi:hypothetical protein
MLLKVVKEQFLLVKLLLGLNLRALSRLGFTIYRYTIADVRIVDLRGRV